MEPGHTYLKAMYHLSKAEECFLQRKINWYEELIGSLSFRKYGNILNRLETTLTDHGLDLIWDMPLTLLQKYMILIYRMIRVNYSVPSR